MDTSIEAIEIHGWEPYPIRMAKINGEITRLHGSSCMGRKIRVTGRLLKYLGIKAKEAGYVSGNTLHLGLTQAEIALLPEVTIPIFEAIGTSKLPTSEAKE